MSSIDRRTASKLAKMWTAKIAPAAEAMEERGVNHLDEELNDDDSWFVTVDSTRSSFTTIENAEMADQLRELWNAKDRSELAELSDEIIALAAQVNRDRGPANAELSSDVYAMY